MHGNAGIKCTITAIHSGKLALESSFVATSPSTRAGTRRSRIMRHEKVTEIMLDDSMMNKASGVAELHISRIFTCGTEWTGGRRLLSRGARPLRGACAVSEVDTTYGHTPHMGARFTFLIRHIIQCVD
jgi:hypothetical protein